MRDRQNFYLTKAKYLYGVMLLLFISVICVAFNINAGDDFTLARREIILRRIGHELLLQAGDSTSRVLPVKKIAENEYQISFESAFTFQADSLVKISQRLLAKDPLAADYVVTVLNSGKPGVVYGFAISKNEKNDIVACRGRKQPEALYLVIIKFKPTTVNKVKIELLLGGLPFLALVGFFFLKSVKTQPVVNDSLERDFLSLGSALFDVKNRKIIINEETMELTGTETRILHIFASYPNDIIERSRLQKEIWEDEGVIVGRSLDMFISKLRKKLQPIPNINIVVVRGKGYKLEINS
ncbi:winged helix family transcriptional regulator [Pedobacter aquatilis]|uniref:winged helix family transcriptional regulator n=1 Tax=Pedobacter aquatilis TaxID=351343 RepID=UPI002930DA7D|nr:winged helix-turn-helix domain-containing protein [Pedobacter aquatilis]